MSDEEPQAIEKTSYRDLLVLKVNGHAVDEFEFYLWRREEELLRSALNFPRHYVNCGITPGHFTAPLHVLAWSALIKLMEEMPAEAKSQKPDPGLLLSTMRTMDSSLDGPRGTNWLNAMVSELPIHPEYGMGVHVKEMIHYNRLRNWCGQQQMLTARVGKDPDVTGIQSAIVSYARGFVYEVDGEQRVQVPLDCVEWDARDKSRAKVVRTGIGAVDKAAGGGPGLGELLVWGGGTGDGKSYAAQRLLRNQARLGQPALYISCEDPQELMHCRMIADFAEPHLSPKEVRLRMADPEVVDTALQRMKDELKGQITVVQKVKPTVSEVCSLIRYYKYTKHVQMVIVDYLQAVTEDDAKGDFVRETSSVIRKLKKCFSECQVAGVVMTQYSRKEYHDGEEPSINAAKYAGDIENESEVLVFMWRDKKKVLHVKLPKVKWSAAKALRYTIKVNSVTGCHGEWEDDYEDDDE
jgi:KaiC/GvpD/RAD55 family RecA-like ATPase